MKKFLPFIAAIAISSCTSQKNVSPGKSDTTLIASDSTASQNETKSATPTKTAILNNPSPEANANNSNNTAIKSSAPANTNTNKEVNNNLNAGNRGLPYCLNKLVTKFRQEEVQNPPRKIYSYSYNGNIVYYVTPPCCDFFSDLYDKNCNLIAHPDGGITGRGDGRAKDFLNSRSNEKLVWEDSRNTSKKKANN